VRVDAQKEQVLGRRGSRVYDMRQRRQRRISTPVDDASISYNTSGQLQAYDYENAADEAPTATSRFWFQDVDGDGDMALGATIKQIVDAVADWSGVNWSTADFTGAAWTDHDTEIEHDHGELLGLADDDHRQYHILGIVTDKATSYLRNTEDEVTPTDNYMGRTLWVETAVNVDTINEEDGTSSINVTGHSLAGTWTVVTEIQSPSHSIDVNNFWQASQLNVDVSGAVAIGAGTTLALAWTSGITVQGSSWEVRKVRMIDDDSGAEITRDVLMSVS
jgi:hypothetical protein